MTPTTAVTAMSSGLPQRFVKAGLCRIGRMIGGGHKSERRMLFGKIRHKSAPMCTRPRRLKTVLNFACGRAASPTAFGERVSKWPPAEDEPSYFRLSGVGPEEVGSENYYGLSVALQTSAGPMWISVARTEGSDALIKSVLREFIFDTIWVTPLLMVATLSIGIFVIRNGLRPVREISRKAASIGPNSTSIRLPEQNLPTEVTPLVVSMNRALDRLENGFAMQREFTANAAHELRTPLAIVTSALETMDGDGEFKKLRTDVARMNRLVEQLLRFARLDAIALEFHTVDLNEVASSVVATMAPWAIAQEPLHLLAPSNR